MQKTGKTLSFLDKLLIVFLIICLSMGNFMIVGQSLVSYAKDALLDSQQASTINKNVKFDTYFNLGNGNTHYLVSDVNTTNEDMVLNLSVGTGYLKDAVIELQNPNYILNNVLDNEQKVQSATANEIKLKQINENENIEIGLSIIAKLSQNMPVEDVSKDSKVVLKAIYVDEKGNEIEIEKAITINISWTGNFETVLTGELVKNISFIQNQEEKELVQVEILSNLKEVQNKLPVKNNNIQIQIPELDGAKPEEIIVNVQSTASTNGQEDNVVIPEESIVKDLVNGIITIKIENNPVDGSVWAGNGQDKILVTYIYNKKDMQGINKIAESKVTSQTNMYSENVLDSAVTLSMDLSQAKGTVVSLDLSTTNTEISKGNMYANTLLENKQFLTEFGIKTVASISYKELATEIRIADVDTCFTDANGNLYPTASAYYKNITFNKANLEEILGTSGEVRILDLSGNVLATVNNSLTADNDGNYVVEFTSNYNKVILDTTVPVAEGDLVITATKAIGADVEYTKAQINLFNGIKVISQIQQKENEAFLALENKETNIMLTETYTNANISLNSNTLSTIVNNEDVELKIELDNSRESTDFYKNGVFKIVFPEYIEDVEIKNGNILYAEGLMVKDVIKQVEDGRVVIYVTLEGTQTNFSTGTVTNGTNIIFGTNVKTKLLTPTTEDTVKLYYSNENAVQYKMVDEATGFGYNEAKVNFVAPVGMLAVNRISGYDETGKSIISVNQGTVTDKIKMDSDAKNAKMDLMLINNTGSVCDTVKILGRIPFAGNKNVGTNEDLQTTVNTMMIQGITLDSELANYAKIYYSTNGEATDVLTDANNMWQENVSDFSDIKSYMIVFENYELKQGEIVNMSYNFIVPEKIDLNNSLYGTFGASYEKKSEVGIMLENVAADPVGLTTGAGPIMEINQVVSVGENAVAQEGQIIKYTVRVKNTGTNDIENLKIRDYLPEYTSYIEYQEPESLQGTELTYTYPETLTDSETGKKYVEWVVGTVKPEETVVKEIYVKVNKLPTILEYYGPNGVYTYAENEYLDYDEQANKYYLVTLDSTTGNTTRKEITSVPEIKVWNTVHVSAADLEEGIDKKSTESKVEERQFLVEETSEKTPSIMLRESEGLTYTITVRNNTQNTIQNVQFEKVIPEGVDFTYAYATKYNSETGKNETVATAENLDNKTVKLVIPSLDANEMATIKVATVTSLLPDGIYDKKVTTSSAVYANGISKHLTNEVENTVAKPHLIVEQTSDGDGEYVSEGKRVTFTLRVKNEGKISSGEIYILDEISNKFKPVEAYYTLDNGSKEYVSIGGNELKLNANIPAGSEMKVYVTVVADELLNSVKEETVENVFNVGGENIGVIKSNIIKKTIEQSTEINKPENDKEHNNNNNNNSGSNNNNNNNNNNNGNTNNPITEVKTYKIKGTAWLDSNSNGARESDEKLFAGIKVTLINAKTGDIITDRTTGQAKETLTKEDGTYEFDNLIQGDYIVVFYHNSDIYGVTEYGKPGVSTELNSDVILATVKDNDKTITVAVTNTLRIDSNSISGVDLGLIITKQADLKLDKYVSNITVQNKDGVKAYNMNDTTLAKIDIAAKRMAGSVVVVEYAIVVTNEGNLPAYAKNIVDYMPKDMKFSSDLNNNWYAGNDGNLYSTELANVAINPGESKTVKLILTKQMTDTNTGVSNNRAEIYEEYNELGITDIDSMPANQAQGEDDLGSANVIISTKTGEEVTYITTILVALVILVTGIYFIRKKTARYYN